MNENEFEFEGKTYVAVDGKNCQECAAIGEGGCGHQGMNNIFPWCDNYSRTDKRDVHFKEKQ